MFKGKVFTVFGLEVTAIYSWVLTKGWTYMRGGVTTWRVWVFECLSVWWRVWVFNIKEVTPSVRFSVVHKRQRKYISCFRLIVRNKYISSFRLILPSLCRPTAATATLLTAAIMWQYSGCCTAALYWCTAHCTAALHTALLHCISAQHTAQPHCTMHCCTAQSTAQCTAALHD